MPGSLACAQWSSEWCCSGDYPRPAGCFLQYSCLRSPCTHSYCTILPGHFSNYRPTVFTFVRFLLSLLLRSYFTLLLFAELLSNVQKQRNLHQLQNLPMKKAFRRWQKYYICPLRFYLFIYFCLSIHFWQCLELRHWVRHSFSLNQHCHCHLQILGEVSWPLQIIIMVPLVFNPSKAHL